MTDTNTSDYYRQREQQERSLAAAAFDPCAKAAHLELANRYASYTGSIPMVDTHRPEGSSPLQTDLAARRDAIFDQIGAAMMRPQSLARRGT